MNCEACLNEQRHAGRPPISQFIRRTALLPVPNFRDARRCPRSDAIRHHNCTDLKSRSKAESKERPFACLKAAVMAQTSATTDRPFQRHYCRTLSLASTCRVADIAAKQRRSSLGPVSRFTAPPATALIQRSGTPRLDPAFCFKPIPAPR